MSALSEQGDERKPHRVDVKVGEAIRARRKILGMSQDSLATELGVSFQQVQKYERGTNRISASMLFKASTALKTPIEFFFDGIDEETDPERMDQSFSEREVTRFMRTAEGLELAEAFPKIRNPAWRRKVTELAKSLANPDDLPKGRKAKQ